WLRAPFRDPTLRTHQAALPAPPPLLTEGLGSVIEMISDDDARWWDPPRIEAFLTSLSPRQAQRLETFRISGGVAYRTAYRRTRGGKPVWEARPDDISGCLRTARGGSSKQAVVRAGQGSVRVRWMTPREYARLMGAGDYRLDSARANQALFGFGDAVCVPAVEWLARHYVLPLVQGEL
ncbi:MAG: DNA cytosine methyltransferase, partial [Micromonosporaceae bacterium]